MKIKDKYQQTNRFEILIIAKFIFLLGHIWYSFVGIGQNSLYVGEIRLASPTSYILLTFFASIIIDILGLLAIKKYQFSQKVVLLFYLVAPFWNFNLYVRKNYFVAISMIFLLLSLYYFRGRDEKSKYLIGIILLICSCLLVPLLFIIVPPVGCFVYKRVDSKKSKWYMGILTLICLLSLFRLAHNGKIITDFESNETAVVIVGIIYIYIQFFVFRIHHFTLDLLLDIVLVLSGLYIIYAPTHCIGYMLFTTIFFIVGRRFKIDQNVVVLIWLTENIIGVINQLMVHPSIELHTMIFCINCLVLIFLIKNCINNPAFQYGDTPFVVGIAGDSGAGKSTLLVLMDKIINNRESKVLIEGDGDHKWERSDLRWGDYTALNPEANNLYNQAYNIIGLKQHGREYRHDYDHTTGLFTQDYKIKNGKYIFVAGLHSFFLSLIRENTDVKIFLDTDTKLQKNWKIKRDMKERGYSKEKVLQQISRREIDVEKYIMPQKQYADLIIKYYDRTLNDFEDVEHNEILSVDITVSMEHNLENLLLELKKSGIYIKKSISDEFNWQTLDVDGSQLIEANIDLESIARKTIPMYEDLFPFQIEWENGINGIVQLFIIVTIGKRLRKGL